MKQLSKLLTGISLVLILVATLLLGACAQPAPAPAPAPAPTPAPTPAPAPAPAPKWEPPKQMVVIGADVATGTYAYTVGLVNGIAKTTGVNFFVTPASSATARNQLLRDGNGAFVLDSTMSTYVAAKGITDFESIGPQKIRIAWFGGISAQGFAAWGDSGIKVPADIKGKKFADYRQSYPMVGLYTEAFLNYTQLTWDDVIAVPVGGVAGGYQAIVDGTVDVGVMSADTPLAKELAASVHGIQWLEMPNKTAEDKAAWARYQDIFPPHVPYTSSTAAGASPEHPVDIWGWIANVYVMDDANEDMVYWLTKSIAGSYDAFKENHAMLKQFTLDNTLDLNNFVQPFHAGAIKYFKEIGRWTPQHEERQQALLKKFV